MSNNIPNVPGNWAPPILYSTPISDRLDELLGDIHLTDGEWEVDLDGMYSAAVAEVADLLAPETLVSYCAAPVILTVAADSIPVTGAKVLYVRRQDNLVATGGPFYECTEVTISQFQHANIADSIYAATVQSPVYVVAPYNGEPTLQILPLPSAGDSDPSTAEVYLFEYPSAMPVSAASTIAGMPNQLTMAILLRTATHVLNAYLAWAVHEEEDNEIVALVSAQIQAYQAAYQAEMKRYMEGATE
tara:strand:+ start:517 stop:1251 length:735 start_codon:yes stop_codon:yes gene_type:complete